MNYARIAIGGAAVWVASIGLGYLIHDIWLLRLYQANAWAFRRAGDVSGLVPIGLGAQLLAAFAFAYAYAKGYQGKGSGLGEGIRYGLVMAVMIAGFAVIWNYITQPIAPRLGALEVLAVIAQLGVYGAIVGLIYDRKAPPGDGQEAPEGASDFRG